jgi:hypothetical protein
MYNTNYWRTSFSHALFKKVPNFCISLTYMHNCAENLINLSAWVLAFSTQLKLITVGYWLVKGNNPTPIKGGNVCFISISVSQESIWNWKKFVEICYICDQGLALFGVSWESSPGILHLEPIILTFEGLTWLQTYLGWNFLPAT